MHVIMPVYERADGIMRIALCDDDKKDLEYLKQLLLKYDTDRGCGFVIDCCSSAGELDGAMQKALPDILFLDINMEEMDGLTIAAKIRESYPDLPIILVTAYIGYAIDGYKVRANRFLVKDDLEKTLTECMDDILAQIANRQAHMLFSCVEGSVSLLLSDIVYIEVTGHKSIITVLSRTQNADGLTASLQKYHLYEKLEELEKKLSAYGFARSHKSFLVNLRHVRKISNYLLTLDIGEELPVSKARYKAFRQAYTLYAGAHV